MFYPKGQMSTLTLVPGTMDIISNTSFYNEVNKHLATHADNGKVFYYSLLTQKWSQTNC